MNCDEAFERLTDPNRRQDDQLRRHLETCPRCRQMQETLEPALSLFDAALDPTGENWTPPAIGPDLPELDIFFSDHFPPADAVDLAERSAAELAAHAEAEHRPASRHWLYRLGYAAAFLLGGGVTFAFFGLSPHRDKRPSGAARPVVFQRCAWQFHEEADSAPKPDSHDVVLSCVACHLGDALD